jgi:hypothetical protein
VRASQAWLGLALAGLLGAASATPALGQGPTPGAAPPQVSLDRDAAGAGDRLTVHLAGWPAGNVLIELCGNEAGRGSADCAVGSSVQTHVPASGTTAAVMPVAAPPVPCPCVVRVRDLAGTTAVTASFTVTGDPGPAAGPGAGSPPAGEPPVLTGVAVTGGWTWPALFGGPARRTVTFTVDNPGDRPLGDPPALLLGRGDHPTTLLDAPELEPVPPGERRTYRVPVTLPAPAFGSYTVRGEVAGAAFLAETTSYPWGLTAVLATLVVVTVLARLRRRPRRQD